MAIKTASDLAAYSPDALNVLLQRECRSFSRGSDVLVAIGAWEDDGQLTDFGLGLINDAKRWDL